MYHHRFESFVQPSPRDGLRPRLGRLSVTLGLRLRSAASPAVSLPSLLPLEIAFLLDFGVPRIVLQHGAGLARRYAVFADEALLAEGLVDEEVFYRALAERLGLRFHSSDVEIERGSDFRLCAERGYARLAGEGGAWICAPQGAALRSLLGAARTPQARESLAITTRAKFLDAAARATLDTAARTAPFCAERAAPELCARKATQGAALPIAIAVSLATLLVLLFSPNGALALAAALPLAIVFSAAVALRLAACVASLAPDEPESELSYDCLPIYTIVVPLYREARVAPQIARAIDRLDYPRAKLDVIFVVEESDEADAPGLATLRPALAASHSRCAARRAANQAARLEHRRCLRARIAARRL